MAGILRLSNTGTGNGQSTITSAASGDTTYTLPSGGGTFVTTGSTQSLTVPFASGTAGAPSVTFIGDTDTGLYSPGANQVAISTSGTGRLFVASDGKVGVGTTSPDCSLHVDSSTDGVIARIKNTAGLGARLAFESAGVVNTSIGTPTGGGAALAFYVAGASTERARIDTSGRLLVGTSTARSNFFNSTDTTQTQIEGGGSLALIRNIDDQFGGALILAKSRSTGNTIVQSGDAINYISFQGSDGSEFVEAARIDAVVDGTPGSNDMPGRIVFSTTSDGASSPTERMRITSQGVLKATTDGTYNSSLDTIHEFRQSGTARNIIFSATNPSYAETVVTANVHRSANVAYAFYGAFSGNFADAEFALYGDGNGKCDGSWTGGGADYAEYFEWSDSNPTAEDRRGISVVLDSNKIREAQAGEDPIGVISGNPSVVGDSAWNKWSGKYLRDEYGTYILDENGERQLNPAYDPDVEYVSREERPEWDCVGLMGKLRIRKGQVTGSRWIKMRDISDLVEEWLVR